MRRTYDTLAHPEEKLLAKYSKMTHAFWNHIVEKKKNRTRFPYFYFPFLKIKLALLDPNEVLIVNILLSHV